MPSVTVAMAVLEQGDVYHFQLRNGVGMTGALGLIGCFGGKIELGETPSQALCRELSEESNLNLAEEQLHYIGEVDAVAERQGKPWDIHAKVFRVLLNTEISVEAKEGELVSMTLPEVHGHMERLTPATRAAFKQLV